MGILFWRSGSKSTGQRGECLAADYLRQKGLKILETNFRNKNGIQLGEIDIVAKDGDQLVFVEVKASLKADPRSACPMDRISAAKLKRLEKAGHSYLKANNLSDYSYRFDAVAVVLEGPDNRPDIAHAESIFL